MMKPRREPFSSPFGLPALAGWLLAKLDELNGSLRGFIMG